MRYITKAEILKNYRTPGHPTAFSAPENVAQFYSIPPRKAKEALEHEDAYNLHREYKKPVLYNPYYVYERRKLIQADLIDIKKLNEYNDGKSHIILLIDVFTRRIWAYPLRTKTAGEMVHTLNRWLQGLRTLPDTLMTDAGTEFFNHQVKSFLQNRKINLRKAVGTSKACYAERANKTLQILIFKYLTGLETLRYIDVLHDLVQTYNSRQHRALENMSPEEADDPSNENRVKAIQIRRYNRLNGKRKKPIFQEGDVVRIKTDSKAPSSSRRAYAEQYHGEYFEVKNVNKNFPIPMYILKSLNSGEEVEGAFYSNELSRIRGSTFKIERVMRRRKRRGQPEEVLVRWLHFGPQWDQWIPANQLQTMT